MVSSRQVINASQASWYSTNKHNQIHRGYGTGLAWEVWDSNSVDDIKHLATKLRAEQVTKYVSMNRRYEKPTVKRKRLRRERLEAAFKRETSKAVATTLKRLEMGY